MTKRRDLPGITLVGLTQRRNTKAFGGAPVVIVNLANHFSRRGFPVEVLIFTRKDVIELPYRFDSDISVRRLTGQSGSVLLAQILSRLMRFRPGRLLAVGNKACRLAVQAARVPVIGCEVWATLHHGLGPEMAGWNDRKRDRRIRFWRRVVSRSRGLIVVSRGVAEEFAAITRVRQDKVHVVYNPVIQPQLAQIALEPIDHPWPLDGGPPIILGVGRLTKEKDFSLLIRAFAQAKAVRPCRLLIIGEGEERDRLVALAAELGVSDSVDLPGFQPNPMPYMQAARLLVLSSPAEGFGNVLVEALYCGTAVVSTDCPHGPREILAGGKYGRLVPVGDPKAMAAAILQTLTEEVDGDRLRVRAMEFSVEHSGDRYLETMGLGTGVDEAKGAVG
jgi:glycosyltransferase involved in cell wall biosynthesis